MVILKVFWRSFLEPWLSLFSTTFSACIQCHSLGTVTFFWQKKSACKFFDTHTPHIERGACDSHGHDRKPACLTNRRKKADCSYGDGEGQKIPAEPKVENIRRNTEWSRENCIPRCASRSESKADRSPVIDRTDPQCDRKSGMCEEHGCRHRCVMNQRRSLIVSLMSLCTVSGTRSYSIFWNRYTLITSGYCFDFQLKRNLQAVWRIRDVYPGSRIRLFSIPDPHQRI